MTARTPLYYNGSQLQEMKSTDITSLQSLSVYYYAQNPSRTLSVVGSGGDLTSIDDTRLQAGAASTASGGYPSEATTAEPSVVTVSYQRISQAAASVTTTSDTGKTFPVYYNGTEVQAMTEQDFLDTFIYPAVNLLSSGSTTSDQAGTYHISTSTSVTGSTLVSSTPVFSDTRADTSLYQASEIGETLDQPQTITNYYLHQIDGVLNTPNNPPIYIDGNNDLKQYSIAEIGALMGEFVRDQVVNSSTGYQISYNIDGSIGNARGSAMVNTILTGGSGNYQTRFVDANDYRAQEFPDGTPATANTYVFKIQKS
jgi:hypothetical protein